MVLSQRISVFLSNMAGVQIEAGLVSGGHLELDSSLKENSFRMHLLALALICKSFPLFLIQISGVKIGPYRSAQLSSLVSDDRTLSPLSRPPHPSGEVK